MTRARIDDAEIDRQVGARLRQRRLQLGVSQEALGSAVGVSFQQIQKYERGIDRISASRLVRIASNLDVAPAWFLEDLNQDDAPLAAEPEIDRAARSLLRAFGRIEDPAVKRSVLNIVRALSRTAGAPDDDDDD